MLTFLWFFQCSGPHTAATTAADATTPGVLPSFSRVPGTLMDPQSWPQVSRTLLHLESLAEALLAHGYLLQSLPVLVLWDVLNTCVLAPSLPSLSHYARFLHCHTLRR